MAAVPIGDQTWHNYLNTADGARSITIRPDTTTIELTITADSGSWLDIDVHTARIGPATGQ